MTKDEALQGDIPVDGMGTVNAPMVGATCRIVRLDANKIRVTCTAPEDAQALREILRRGDALVVLEVAPVRGETTEPSAAS
jgi:hypothetical protein